MNFQQYRVGKKNGEPYSPARENTAEIVRLYQADIGHKTIAKQLGISPRIARVILIEQGVYKPGALKNGPIHRKMIGDASRARTPAWKRAEKEREAKRRSKRTWAYRDLPLFQIKSTIVRTPESRAVTAAEFRRRYEEDRTFRIMHILRSRVRKVVKRGDRYSEHTLDWLGCTPVEFIAYIEMQWEKGMTWENYGCRVGQWSIDHKRPCASFQLNRAEDRAQCFHFSNMQPMWATENTRKGSMWEGRRHRHAKDTSIL